MSSSGLECSLCTKFAIEAQICEQCGSMYCQACLHQIFGREYLCVQCQSIQFRHIKNTDLYENYSEILSQSQLLDQFKKDANPITEQQILQGVQGEQIIYLQQKCKNYEMCQNNVNQIYQKEQLCSHECLYFTQLFPLMEQSNFVQIREEIIKLEQTMKNKQSVQLVQKVAQPIQNNQCGITNFVFDRGAQGIIINLQFITLQEQVYKFKTVTSSIGFQQGIHFWKIKLLPMTQNEIKIGVSTSENYDLRTAFSDHSFGYAYYTVGKFINGSTSNISHYGVNFKNEGEVGVLLDMNRGILAFSYNGNFLGRAIRSQFLTQGPIFPCVALVHEAGFQYQCGIPIPQNLLEQFLK